MATDRSSVHTFTKLKDEPFFIQCGDRLKQPDGTQAATITSIDTQRLENKTSDDPVEWSEAVPSTGFSSMQILGDPSGFDNADMIGGILDADRDDVPADGDGYMIVVECTVTLVAALGGGSHGMVFRRPARIVAGSVTAPAS